MLLSNLTDLHFGIMSAKRILFMPSGANIRRAIEGFPEKYAVIGFDRAGNPLEIMYNPIDDNSINVFHAMKARKSFLDMLKP